MPNSESDKAWHSLDTASVLSDIGATAAGLTTEEAVKRLAADGPKRTPQSQAGRCAAYSAAAVQELDCCHLNRRGSRICVLRRVD